ncbi:MAG: c-type cytochrome [Pirellulaceae bacterium]|nr:c-type cytochrome [Pirellulaceae bacterium]
MCCCRLRGGSLAAGLVLLVLSLSQVPARENPPDNSQVDSLVSLLELVIEADADSARQCLELLAQKIQARQIDDQQLQRLRPRLEPVLRNILNGQADHPLFFESHLLAASWKHSASLRQMADTLGDPRQPESRRVRAATALAALADPRLAPALDQILSPGQQSSSSLRAALLAAAGSGDDPRIAQVVLARYEQLEAELQPKAIELLLQRTAWSRQLLEAIGQGKLPAEVLHQNQVARLLASRDQQLVALVRAKWGTVRTERNPQREAVLTQMRELLSQAQGDPLRGQAVFDRVCGQCHRIHGRGQQVGPEITSNGRGSFEQLLSNVFDPSLVIGSAYQARTVITADGRVLTGLLVEDSPQRVVLNLQGGKQETIARDDVDEVAVSQLSLMPEGVEQQLKPDELADLFAYLVLERPPDQRPARLIPGTPVGLVAP